MKTPQVYQQMNRYNIVLHTTEYYSTTKGTEVLIHAILWMNLKNSILSERSQAQKVTYCMVPII